MTKGENKSQEFVFEKRPYNSDCTELEKQAILDRVTLLNTNVVLIKEIPFTTVYSVDCLFTQAAHLSAHLEKYVFLIDVREASKPSAEARRKINEELIKASPKLNHVAFCTGKNQVFNTICKFVMFRTNLESYSFHRTIEECFNAINKASNE